MTEFNDRGSSIKAVVSALLLACLFLGIDFSSAAQKDPPPEAKKDSADEATIRALIKQLGDDSFEKRDLAGKRLAEIGVPALPFLEKAAKDESDLETRTRAADLVRMIGRSFFHEVRRYEGHAVESQRKATRIVVSPDGRFAVSSGSGLLRHWDIESGKEILAFGPISRSSYWALSLSADGKRVIAGGEDNLVRVFDLETGKELHQLVGHTDQIRGALFLPDGKRAVTTAWDGSIRLWDLETGKETLRFDDVGESVRGMALAPGGKILAAAHYVDRERGPGTIRLWDVDTGKLIRAFERVELPILTVSYFPDGKTLLSGGFDGTLRIWDAATGKELKRLEFGPHRIEYAAITPDGKRVVACADNPTSTVRVWDVASGTLVAESEVTGGGFLCVATLPDNQRCMTATRDGVVRLWQWKK